MRRAKRTLLARNRRNRLKLASRRGRLETLEQRRLLAADVVGLSPADDATAVAVGGDLVLTFSENVRPGPGSGNILIKDADDDSVIFGANVNSEAVTFDGATVTINPPDDLPANTNFYVEVDPSAIRDMSDDVTEGAVLFDEDFERLHMLDSDLALDGEFNPDADLNDYVVVFEGTFNVLEGGEYTFGGNSDDGMWLAIDLEQDGEVDIFDFDDEVIFDDTTHGNQDRLSTCGAFAAVQSCEGAGEVTIELEEGEEYMFQYAFFERGGGSSGEFFYSKGTVEAFAEGNFVLVGDPSQGLEVVGDGVTATTHKADADQIGTINAALDLIDGFIDSREGFPATETLPTADVWNTGGTGRFPDDHPVPGAPPSDPGEGTDYSPEPPFGWTGETPPPTPSGGRPEFNGWVPLDKNFWINQQGNQGRTEFEGGEGVIAVVDPDAFDDFIDIDADGGLLNAFYTTPAIDLTDVAAESVNLSFNSSFRSEPTQIGVLEVSFDGGANWDRILEYDGAVEPDQEHDDELLSFDLDNPSGGTLHVRFGMLQASNDWWWAVDNIVVTGDVTGVTHAGIADRETWNFNTFLGETVFFEQDFDAAEADGQVEVTVVRAGGDSNNPLTVDYATVDGSAKAGSDYEAANGTIEFAAGETEKTIVVNLIDDADEERAETFSIALSNASGGAIAGAAANVTIGANDGSVLVFQQGAEVTLDGAGTGMTYEGTQDADPHGGDEADDVRDRAELNVDGEDGGTQAHGLTKFEGIIGDGPGQVPNNLPQGVVIAKATLVLNVTNEGSDVQVHRMLADWDQTTVTWNTLTFNGNTDPGLQPDDVELTSNFNTKFPAPAAVAEVDVTADVQAWVDGEDNFGWGFIPTGTNGVDWDSAEAADVAVRPQLIIEFVDVEDVPDLLEGDVDGDGDVDLTDFNLLKDNFGISEGATRGEGDLDGDGDVDLTDFNILKDNFGAQAAVDAVVAALADDGGDDEWL